MTDVNKLQSFVINFILYYFNCMRRRHRRQAAFKNTVAAVYVRINLFILVYLGKTRHAK